MLFLIHANGARHWKYTRDSSADAHARDKADADAGAEAVADTAAHTRDSTDTHGHEKPGEAAFQAPAGRPVLYMDGPIYLQWPCLIPWAFFQTAHSVAWLHNATGDLLVLLLTHTFRHLLCHAFMHLLTHPLIQQLSHVPLHLMNVLSGLIAFPFTPTARSRSQRLAASNSPPRLGQISAPNQLVRPACGPHPGSTLWHTWLLNTSVHVSALANLPYRDIAAYKRRMLHCWQELLLIMRQG